MTPFHFLPIAVILSGTLAAPSATDVSKWEAFKALHGKRHAPSEEAARMATFLKRSAEIEAHNARYEAGLESFSLNVNQYSDLTDEEFDDFAFGFDHSNVSVPKPHSLKVMPNLPESLDYRTHGIMTPVKSQKFCGSCYAFAVIGMLESYILRTTGQAYDLSEQDVVDCSYHILETLGKNNGCKGGHPSVVLQYLDQKGLVEEKSYPYTSGKTNIHDSCQVTYGRRDILQRRLVGHHVQLERESDLKQYLVQYGPLVIGMASDKEYKHLFRDLKDGIFDIENTSDFRPNHVVVVVGYGRENGKDYWLIRNSWGKTWGVGGYGKIAAGKNMVNLMTSGIWFLE